jgi:hypothetical protein
MTGSIKKMEWAFWQCLNERRGNYKHGKAERCELVHRQSVTADGTILAENRMVPLMLKTDFFVGIQQILVADITYYVLITAYPLQRRSQLTVT